MILRFLFSFLSTTLLAFLCVLFTNFLSRFCIFLTFLNFFSSSSSSFLLLSLFFTPLVNFRLLCLEVGIRFWSSDTEVACLLFGPRVCREFGRLRRIFCCAGGFIGVLVSFLGGTIQIREGGSWDWGIAAIGGGIGVKHGGVRAGGVTGVLQHGLAVPLALNGARALIAPCSGNTIWMWLALKTNLQYKYMYNFGCV